MTESNNAPLSVDAELEKKLELYLQLKKAASKYEKIKEELKEIFNGVTNMRVGRFVITGKEQSRAERINKAHTYWDWKAEEAIDLNVLAAAQGEGA